MHLKENHHQILFYSLCATLHNSRHDIKKIMSTRTLRTELQFPINICSVLEMENKVSLVVTGYDHELRPLYYFHMCVERVQSGPSAAVVSVQEHSGKLSIWR